MQRCNSQALLLRALRFLAARLVQEVEEVQAVLYDGIADLVSFANSVIRFLDSSAWCMHRQGYECTGALLGVVYVGCISCAAVREAGCYLMAAASAHRQAAPLRSLVACCVQCLPSLYAFKSLSLLKLCKLCLPEAVSSMAVDCATPMPVCWYMNIRMAAPSAVLYECVCRLECVPGWCLLFWLSSVALASQARC
jgi:hypothetical protein